MRNILLLKFISINESVKRYDFDNNKILHIHVHLNSLNYAIKLLYAYSYNRFKKKNYYNIDPI